MPAHFFVRVCTLLHAIVHPVVPLGWLGRSCGAAHMGRIASTGGGSGGLTLSWALQQLNKQLGGGSFELGFEQMARVQPDRPSPAAAAGRSHACGQEEGSSRSGQGLGCVVSPATRGLSNRVGNQLACVAREQGRGCPGGVEVPGAGASTRLLGQVAGRGCRARARRHAPLSWNA